MHNAWSRPGSLETRKSRNTCWWVIITTTRHTHLSTYCLHSLTMDHPYALGTHTCIPDTVPQGMGLSRLSESDLWLLIRCTPRLVDYMYIRLLYVLMWQMACLDGKSVCWGGVWRVRGSQWNVAQYDCHLPEEMAEALIGSSIFELRCLSVCMQADASYKSVFDLEI